jgi:hypothetical protein
MGYVREGMSIWAVKLVEILVGVIRVVKLRNDFYLVMY